MIMHLINYFFNQGQRNLFEIMVLFLYRNALPYLNIILAIICIVLLLINKHEKIKFTFEKELKYLFLFLLISISTSAAKTVLDPDFVFYLVTVIVFTVTLGFLPVEAKEPNEKSILE